MVWTTSDGFRHNTTIVLMAPNDEVDTVIEEAFWYSWSWRVRNTTNRC
jgi:hypothetical protein